MNVIKGSVEGAEAKSAEGSMTGEPVFTAFSSRSPSFFPSLSLSQLFALLKSCLDCNI